MKQIRAFGPQDLRMVTVEEPELLDEEVMVEVHACGICGSDKWFWYVESYNDYVAGHEVAGKVVKVGSNVKRLRVGDRVAVNNVKGCGICSACKEGQYVRCTSPLTHMGFGFSEKVAVPERNCLVLDQTISYEIGSLIFDNWGTPYSAINRTDMKPGDTVLVTGCGPVGLAAIALSKYFGAKVIAVDPVQSRLDAAENLGVELAVQPSGQLEETINTFVKGEGVDIVLECSGKSASYKLAFSILKMAGTLVSIGEGAKFGFNSSEIIHKHLQIIGSLYSTMKDGEEIQKLIVSGVINPLAFVSHRFSLDELPQEFGKVIEFSEGLLKSVVVKR